MTDPATPPASAKPAMTDDCPDMCSRWPGCGHTIADFDALPAEPPASEEVDAAWEAPSHELVVETKCANCGWVERTKTTVDALTKARDWAYRRSDEGAP